MKFAEFTCRDKFGDTYPALVNMDYIVLAEPYQHYTRIFLHDEPEPLIVDTPYNEIRELLAGLT